MPKCNRCPIKVECNRNAILVENPAKPGEKVRLCPLIVAISHALKPAKPEGEL